MDTSKEIDRALNVTSKNTFPLIRATDGTEQILFGDLFKLNEKISNKCVGLLQRARKYRFDFNHLDSLGRIHL